MPANAVFSTSLLSLRLMTSTGLAQKTSSVSLGSDSESLAPSNVRRTFAPVVGADEALRTVDQFLTAGAQRE